MLCQVPGIFSYDMKKYLLPLLATVACSAVACGGDEPAPAPEASSVKPSVESISFEYGGGSSSFTVETSGEWDAATSDAWLSLSKNGTASKTGSVTVTATENTARTERTGKITIISGRARAEVAVTQQPRPAQPVDHSIEVPEGYELVWNDEFNSGSVPDPAKWRHEVQGPGWVNNELQTYVNGAYDGRRVTEIADGILSITAFKSGNAVYSGRIYGNETQGWKYGIFEARLKLPKGKGTWPAFWMMPSNNDFNTTPWPLCGEIDIMEEVGYNPNYTSSSIHTSAYNHVQGTQRTAERLTAGAQDDFHVYRLVWTPEAIKTYVDGTPLLTFTNDGKGDVRTWPFNRPFYIILNLAWGGDWGGAQGVDESALPATMQVDYVRVFQKID